MAVALLVVESGLVKREVLKFEDFLSRSGNEYPQASIVKTPCLVGFRDIGGRCRRIYYRWVGEKLNLITKQLLKTFIFIKKISSNANSLLIYTNTTQAAIVALSIYQVIYFLTSYLKTVFELDAIYYP